MISFFWFSQMNADRTADFRKLCLSAFSICENLRELESYTLIGYILSGLIAFFAAKAANFSAENLPILHNLPKAA